MTTLRIKTKTGHITEMQVEELLEVDGKPFRTDDEFKDVRDAVIHLEGRVSALESALYERVSNG